MGEVREEILDTSETSVPLSRCAVCLTLEQGAGGEVPREGMRGPGPKGTFPSAP